MNFKNSLTQKNLAKAYASECQDSAKFRLLAQNAFEQNKVFLSIVIEKLSQYELAHATVLYNLLLNLGKENIENIEITASYPFEQIQTEKGIYNCLKTEQNQAKNLYPDYFAIAKDEGFVEVAKTFEMLCLVEERNCEILKSILSNNKKEKITCYNCGFEREKKAWKTCPLCHKGDGFIIKDYLI